MLQNCFITTVIIDYCSVVLVQKCNNNIYHTNTHLVDYPISFPLLVDRSRRRDRPLYAYDKQKMFAGMSVRAVYIMFAFSHSYQ